MANSGVLRELLHGKLGSSDRAFGFVMSVFFALLSSWPMLRYGKEPQYVFLGIAVFFLLSAQALPVILRPLNILWTAFGLLLHLVMSPLILGILYFGLFTPIGLLMRVSGRDPLHRALDKNLPSYWIPRDSTRDAGANMRMQF